MPYVTVVDFSSGVGSATEGVAAFVAHHVFVSQGPVLDPVSLDAFEDEREANVNLEAFFYAYLVDPVPVWRPG